MLRVSIEFVDDTGHGGCSVINESTADGFATCLGSSLQAMKAMYEDLGFEMKNGCISYLAPYLSDRGDEYEIALGAVLAFHHEYLSGDPRETDLPRFATKAAKQRLLTCIQAARDGAHKMAAIYDEAVAQIEQESPDA